VGVSNCCGVNNGWTLVGVVSGPDLGCMSERRCMRDKMSYGSKQHSHVSA